MANALTMNFDEVYSKFHNEILTYITFKIGNYALAQELANDVFLKALTDNHTFRNIRTYLHNTANSVVVDNWRKEQTIKSGISASVNVSDYTDENGNDLFTFFSDESADSLIIGKESKAEITKAINGLRPTHKTVAELFFLNELSYEEISNVMQISLVNVKVTILRVREKLQEQLNSLYELA